MIKTAIRYLMAAGVITLGLITQPSTPSDSPPPVVHLKSGTYTNILPLGDSLTFGYRGNNQASNGYRGELWMNLRLNGLTPNFNGTCGGGPNGPGINQCLPENWYTVYNKMGDWNHEGHSGWKTVQLLNITIPPDTQYTLLLTGANDLRLDVPVGQFANDLSALLDSIPPHIHVFVATPTYKTNESDWDDYVWATINVANSKTNTSIVPLHIIGQKAGELFDGVHPTVCGYTRISYVWSYYMGRNILVNPTGKPWSQPYYPFKNPSTGTCKGIA